MSNIEWALELVSDAGRLGINLRIAYNRVNQGLFIGQAFAMSRGEVAKDLALIVGNFRSPELTSIPYLVLVNAFNASQKLYINWRFMLKE